MPLHAPLSYGTLLVFAINSNIDLREQTKNVCRQADFKIFLYVKVENIHKQKMMDMMLCFH